MRACTSSIGIAAAAAALLWIPGSASGQEASFHPPVPILDASGHPVVESGEPLSATVTCGECHDAGFIAGHSSHADAGAASIGEPAAHEWDLGPGWFGAWDPITGYGVITDPIDPAGVARWIATLGTRHAGGGPAAGTEFDCFLCHLDAADVGARNAALAAGNLAEASMATLAATGAVVEEDGHWTWVPDAFDDDGAITGLVVTGVSDSDCGVCHGLTVTPPLVVTVGPLDALSHRSTITTGELFAGDRMLESGANLAGKDSLSRAWDVHAERVVECVHCHHAANDPALSREDDATRPEHLLLDGRLLDPCVYMRRPDHRLVDEQCTTCHDATAAHEWLPYRDRHFAALACETCHIPRVYAPALAAVDHTVVDTAGEPRREWRGIEGEPGEAAALLTGHSPVVLTGDGDTLAPHNLVSTWFWVWEGRPVTPDEMAAALLDGVGHHPDVVAAFDEDGDGVLSPSELVITDAARREAVRDRLAAVGLPGAEIAAEVRSYELHHSVTTGDWAIDDCRACHGSDSVLDANFALASVAPGGVIPEAVDGAAADGRVVEADDGSLSFEPAATSGGLYVFGTDRVVWIDLVGVAAVLLVLAGVAAHGFLRWRAARRRTEEAPRTQAVYLYSVYERMWHWLQTIAILILLGTGLVIHAPDLLGFASFRGIVAIHNIVAVILLLNAALSAFYHLASGEIRQFIPRPRGFFDRAIGQAVYYLRGIFRGDPHPFEKDPGSKLNPLQQATYLAILNLLLPLQIVTGILIWGAQRWPGAASTIGGLTVVAPLHALSAWLFAAFVILHVYLTTTGPTPLAGIKAMVTGWDAVERQEEGVTP